MPDRGDALKKLGGGGECLAGAVEHKQTINNCQSSIVLMTSMKVVWQSDESDPHCSHCKPAWLRGLQQLDATRDLTAKIFDVLDCGCWWNMKGMFALQNNMRASGAVSECI